MNVTTCGKAAWGGAMLVGMMLVSISTPVLAADKAREEIHKTFAFKADGRLSVRNVNGLIRVTAWDRAEVQLDAVKLGENQAAIDAVKVEIDAREDRIEIETRHPSRKWGWGKGSDARVDYTLQVPAGTRVESIHSVNGSVEIEGVRGPVEASTVNGRLAVRGLARDAELSTVNGSAEASFADLRDVKRISVESVNGRLVLTLPESADAEVEATSLNGGISTGFDLAVKKNWPVGRELRGTLGKGTTRVKASTVNGSIKLERGKAD